MKHGWFRRLAAMLVVSVLMLSVVAFAAGDLEIGLDGSALPTSQAYVDDPAEQVLSLGGSQEPEALDLGQAAETNAAVTLAAKRVTLGVKEKFDLKPSGASARSIKFTSTNDKVASVTSAGVVKARRVGKATIKAMVNGKAVAKCKVTVKKAPDKLTMNKKSATLKVGKTLQLKAKPPKGTASNVITWKSSNASVATVSDKGFVTAKKVGEATITAKAFNGAKAVCKVKVKAADYKVAIMTGSKAQGEEEYYAAAALAKKYPKKVVHVLYPDNFYSKTDVTVSRLVSLAGDPDVKAIIFVQAVNGAVEAFTKIAQDMGRDDILLIAGVPAEAPGDITAAADVVLAVDEVTAGKQVGSLAGKWGCDVLVHYSFDRHLGYETIQAKRDAMKRTAKSKGVMFVEHECPDPVADTGLEYAREAILEDIPKVMEEYSGKKVCFYCTNCGLQVALQQAIVNEANAYYALPCCPSPYHGFQEAFGLKASYGDIDGAIRNLANYLNDHNAVNRFSTWRVPVNMSMVDAGYEYACLYAEGKIKGKLDKNKLKKCLANAAGSKINVSTYADASGRKYSNFLQIALEPINFADYL